MPQLVHDRVAQLIIGAHAFMLGNIKRVIRNQGQPGTPVATLHLVPNDTNTKDCRTRTQNGIDIIDQLHARDGALEVVRGVRLSLSTMTRRVVCNVGVGITGIDVQVDPVLVEAIHQLLQNIAVWAVACHRHLRACISIRTRCVAASLLPLRVHPIKLQEQIRSLRISTPLIKRHDGTIT